MVGFMGWAMPQQGCRKGPWTPHEDQLLSQYITSHGHGQWSSVASCAGLNRSGKSCRLRWVNYLRPGLKRGQITPEEEGIITELHALWGNKWATIARYLPGRTDNEIKNYWRTHFKKKENLARKSSGHQKTQHSKPPKPLLLKPQVSEPSGQQPIIERFTNNTSNIFPIITRNDQEIRTHQPTSCDNNQDLTFMYSNMYTTDALDQHDDLSSSTWVDATCHNQNGLTCWGSLWDLDDQAMYQMQHDEYHCGKMASSSHNNSSSNYNTDINKSGVNDNYIISNVAANNSFNLLGRGSKQFVQ